MVSFAGIVLGAFLTGLFTKLGWLFADEVLAKYWELKMNRQAARRSPEDYIA